MTLRIANLLTCYSENLNKKRYKAMKHQAEKRSAVS